MLLLLVFWLRDKNQPTSTLVLEAPDFHPPSENLDQVVRDFRDTRGEATSDVENGVKGPRRRKSLEKPPRKTTEPCYERGAWKVVIKNNETHR